MVVLNLTKAQHNKLMKGSGIQIGHHQLVSGSGEYPVEVDFDKKTHNRLHRNVMNGKGFRLSSRLLDGAKNVAKSVGSHASNLAAKEATKFAMNQIDKSGYVPDELKGGVKSLSSLGINELNKEAKSRLKGGAFNFGKVLGSIGSTLARPLATVAGNMIAGPAGGVAAGNIAGALTGTGGKFKKGSQEAKDHMALIRQMRGKGFLSGLSNVVKKVAPIAVKTLAPIAIDAGLKYATGKGVKNPRVRIPNSNLLLGTPQVSGGSFASYGYAK